MCGIKGRPSGPPAAAQDVIRLHARWRQVGLIGSVNSQRRRAQTSETVADLLVMGGGFAAVADHCAC